MEIPQQRTLKNPSHAFSSSEAAAFSPKQCHHFLKDFPQTLGTDSSKQSFIQSMIWTMLSQQLHKTDLIQSDTASTDGKTNPAQILKNYWEKLN